MKNNNININIPQANSSESKLSAFAKTWKQLFTWIANAPTYRLFKVIFFSCFLFVLITGSIFSYYAFQDKDIVKATANKLLLDQKAENIRDFIVTPKIQKELNTLVYVLNADRAFLFELHNGKKNTTGLPFRYADMTYEETNEDRKIDKVAMNFQNIPLTLYKYPHYLQKKKILIGSVDEIDDIDHDFANHIRTCNGEYLAMIYLNDNGIPLGFLCVSFHDESTMPKKEYIKNKMEEYGKSLTQLLDFDVQMSRNNQDIIIEEE